MSAARRAFFALNPHRRSVVGTRPGPGYQPGYPETGRPEPRGPVSGSKVYLWKTLASGLVTSDENPAPCLRVRAKKA